MKRLAFFVEGTTEVLFIETLIKIIAAEKEYVVIERATVKGGNRIPRQLNIFSNGNTSKIDYYIIIINCQGDQQVKKRILEEHHNFTNLGYEKIIGMRDVRPTFQFFQIPKLQISIHENINLALIPVEIILSTMEIESIFLGEPTHFDKIHPSITPSLIHANLGFNPETEDMELREEPSSDLSNCYAIAGKTYNKLLVQDTINALNFNLIHLEQPKRFKSLERLVSNINSFFIPAI